MSRRAMCAPVPAPRTAGAPDRDGMAGTGAAGAAARAPRLRRGLRGRWGPHPRRDGSGVAVAATPVPPGSQGPLDPRPLRNGRDRSGRVRRARTPPAPVSPGPSPAPGWPGTQRQRRPRREEEAVAGSRPRGERSTMPPIGRSISLLGQIRRLASLRATWPDPLARFWYVNRIRRYSLCPGKHATMGYVPEKVVHV
jgi:hypothetical protein